jgi:hypothetical protein
MNRGSVLPRGFDLATALLSMLACAGNTASMSGADRDAGNETGSGRAADAGAASPPTCPSTAAVQARASCTVSPGVSCPSDTPMFNCQGQLLGDASCTCSQSQWACAPATPSCPGKPGSSACPDPGAVLNGQPCPGIRTGLECPGNPHSCAGGTTFYDGVQCDGAMWVTVLSTGCTPDAGG